MAHRPFNPLFEALLRRTLSRVPPERRLAAFDADGTLWRGDVGDDFFLRLAAQGALTPPDGEVISSPEGWWSAYAALRERDPAYAFGWCCRAMAGLTEDYVREQARQFVDAFLPAHRRGVMAEWVIDLQADGWRVWVVSASNWWVVAEGATRLGLPVKQVIGVRVVVRDGILSSELDGPVTQGAGKVAALRLHGVEHVALAVGNAHGDIELLGNAEGLAVALCPDDILYREARLRSWACVWLDDEET